RAHTAGSQLLEVPTSIGKLVFCSDAFSSYEGIRDWMVANIQQTDSVQEFLGGPERRTHGVNRFGARRKVAETLSRASPLETDRLCSGETDAGPLLKQLAPVCRFALLLLIVTMAAGSVRAHDASSYGGVFRSHNLGGTWL